MATRDLEESLSAEESELTGPETFLPPFPGPKAILRAFPEMIQGTPQFGKPDFLPLLEFTLENPDEIWEFEEFSEKKFFYYVSFLETLERPPAFVVEVCYIDDAMEVNDFSLLTDRAALEMLRSDNLVYCRSKEWAREQFIRNLNDQALLKYDENQLDEARELIDTAIKVSGTGTAYLFNNRGLICWKMGKTDQAKEDFLESISLDQENGDPYFNIGLIYFDEANYGEALRYLSMAVEIDPFDSQFLTELGHLYLEMEREEDALDLFRKAFESNPSDPQVDFHLGHYFLYKKRQPENAIKYYGQGLKKDPQDQFALADLAIAQWVLGNKRKALKVSDLLCKNSRLMPYTISRLVYLNMEMGDYDAALKYYKQALSQKEPFEPEWLHYNAALVYAKTGHPKQALDRLNLAVKVGGEAVIKRALSDKALQQLKRTPDFKRLIKLPAKRRNR